MALNIDEMLQKLFNNEDSKWKPSDKIPAITKEIELLKIDVKTYISGTDFDLSAICKESNELCAESKQLIDDLKKCKQEIEEVTMAEILKSLDNYTILSKELQTVSFALNILTDIVQCGMFIKVFDEGRLARSYTRAVDAVYDLLEYIEKPAKGFECLDFYNNMKHTAQLILDTLLNDLHEEWDGMVKWTTKPNNRKTIITITLKLEDSSFCFDVLNAFYISRKLPEQVSKFGQFLLKDVFVAILHNECTVFAETDELMTITVIHKENFKPRYDAVIANLRLLFHYLSNKLNIEFRQATSIMTMMSKEINVAFRDILVEDCLIDTVPNNLNDLTNYANITSVIQDFQYFLIIIKFFPDEGLSILNYVKNIDVLFANKSSQHFLETARTIMLKDLSVTMSIGVKNISEANSDITANAKYEEALDILESIIPNSLFYFPRCMISKTAQELLDLVYVMMEQAVQCSDVVCKKLYNTTRLIFELYDAVVPYHHENFLQTIPQYVALFHNNCLYLAHNLQTFGDKWLILMEGRQLDYPIGFVDLVQKLRDLGYKHLTIHMQQQRKQILDNIRSSDLNCIVVKDVLSDNAEAAIRQCLRQLQLLKNVWIGVFPINVFTRLMATLVNMFVEELIHRVCTVEDISMEMATQLTEMYSLVVQKAPPLFQTSSDVQKYVKSWIKLQKLIFVLGGSLKDIENHWKDGKGPLAVHFKTEELRSLIKALFQNTQIRANLLSKIK